MRLRCAVMAILLLGYICFIKHFGSALLRSPVTLGVVSFLSECEVFLHVINPITLFPTFMHSCKSPLLFHFPSAAAAPVLHWQMFASYHELSSCTAMCVAKYLAGLKRLPYMLVSTPSTKVHTMIWLHLSPIPAANKVGGVCAIYVIAPVCLALFSKVHAIIVVACGCHTSRSPSGWLPYHTCDSTCVTAPFEQSACHHRGCIWLPCQQIT